MPPPANTIQAVLLEARRALTGRIERYGDDTARALLACVDRLDALGAALTADAIPDALGAAQELAGAARLITFAGNAEDRGLPLHPYASGSTPARPTGPLLTDARGRLGEPNGVTQERGRELLDQLEELLREVLFEADTQSFVDARANEVTYQRAATRISRAASRVAEACRPG